MSVIILVDQDGVIADFDRAFYDLCNELGAPMHSTLETQCHRFATDCITDPDLRREARAVVDTTDWFRDLPVIPGAVAGLNELLEHPDVADVFICTKPMRDNWMCRDSKADWVNRHLGGDWVERLILAPDKSMVRGDVLLDDAPKLQWFDRAEWMPVIYPAPWNHPDSEWSRKNRCDDQPRWDWSMPVNDLVWIAHESRRMIDA